MNKIIHYVWLGKKEKPAIVKSCIDSWKRKCPGFEIKEWNEDNFNLDQNNYLKIAYSNKKYAFASDYIRFHVLEQYGGVYLDTDVELIKNITPLMSSAFIGFESAELLNPGLIIYAEKGNLIIKEVLKYYDSFQDDKIDYDLTVCKIVTEIFKNYGLQTNGTMQDVNGFRVYPVDYFNPRGANCGKPIITENTYSIHHYSATWLPESFQKLMVYRERYGARKGKFYFIIQHPILALKRLFEK